jgi:folate-binding protein YgfZ
MAEAYEHLRATGVVVPRPRGLVRLTGPQRVWFLDNTITNQIEGVPVGRWVESCFLDTKGKVLAHFRVGVGAEVLWLDVDEPGTEGLVDWFTRYRFRTKVEIIDVSPGCCTVLGPGAEAMAADGVVTERDGAVVFGSRLGDVAVADVHGPRTAGLPEAPEEVLEVVRLEAGVARFGVDYGPNTLPQEAGLTHIVSVTKGCYVGQEVMARLHFRGHVNRVLRTLAFDGDPDPTALVGGDVMVDGKRIGTVTSAGRSPARGVIGIALARVEPDAGARVVVGEHAEARLGPVPEGTKVTS